MRGPLGKELRHHQLRLRLLEVQDVRVEAFDRLCIGNLQPGGPFLIAP
jgi:hypothetical protein